MPERPSSSLPKKRHAYARLAMVLAGGVAGVAVGLAGVYGIATLGSNAGGDKACRPAVELAKRYGSDSSSRFVNGVLGSLADRRVEIGRALAPHLATGNQEK